MERWRIKIEPGLSIWEILSGLRTNQRIVLLYDAFCWLMKSFLILGCSVFNEVVLSSVSSVKSRYKCLVYMKWCKKVSK